MTRQIITQILSKDESEILFVVYENESYKIVLYHLEEKRAQTLFTTTELITQICRFNDSIYFIQKEELLQLSIATQQITVQAKASKLNVFNHETFIYEYNHELTAYNMVTNTTSLIVTGVNHLYRTNGEMLLYKKDGEVLFMHNGEHKPFVVQKEVLSAALSFDRQYVAFFSNEKGERHFYVYDIEQQIVQNMTELLGETIGYDGPLLTQQLEVELPAWTETNAFYFLVTANAETRLYYGDLYGTLLPASPEDEYIYAYAIARSGNWAITATMTKQQTAKSELLDITTGSKMEIVF